jgi:uncharacterized protein (DUF433 family)/DNA-binding transcriptional MerR regulator
MLQQAPDFRAIIGRGVYGAADAARLLNFHKEDAPAGRPVSPRTISRWLRGYVFRLRDEVRESPPLWRPDFANDDDVVEVSFRDLVELKFVKAFRDAGLSLPAIRQCLERAAEEVNDPRPFSTRRFRTDGRTIFLEITQDAQEGELIDLRGRQRVFRTIVEPSLRDLEFDADVVARWFPLGPKRSVVIDPARAFGRPSAASVPTQVLAAAVAAEGSTERAARAYEVPIEAVRDALDFERKLAA